MKNRSVTVEIARSDHPTTVLTGLAADDIRSVLRSLEGEPDVTVTISREGTSERLMAAVSGANIFLGLDCSNGLFQYAAHGNDRQGKLPLTIGGQKAEIESRYVLNIETAIKVIQGWLRGEEESLTGGWERQ